MLTRVMKKITGIVGKVGAKLRDRSRSVKYRVMDIGRAARAKGPQSREKLEKAYGNLLNATSRVVGQAKRFAREIGDGTRRAKGIWLVRRKCDLPHKCTTKVAHPNKHAPLPHCCRPLLPRGAAFISPLKAPARCSILATSNLRSRR